METPAPRSRTILLTGASGYVGGRLLRTLTDRGETVRCLSRRPELLAARVPAGVEVVAGDVLDPPSIANALVGVDTVYYLVHSMGSSRPFDEADRTAATEFADAAARAGVRKVIYLGGLGKGELSPHLSSRQEVGRILRDSTVPTIELRASIVIGSGSASFEMIRALVDRLPFMICPRWVKTYAQPIAIEDVIAYLVACLDRDITTSELYEIGGADATTYLDLMKEYARQRGLRRVMVPVPVLTPHLSSLWLGLVTPVYAGIGRKLVDSLRNETIVTNTAALDTFDIVPRNTREAIERALINEDREFAETRWSDEAFSETQPYGGTRRGSRLVDSRHIDVAVPPAAAFTPIRTIGGRNGWYAGNFLWQFRGALDVLVGGPGLRRGRRDPANARVGDTIDFWRVEAVTPNALLRLQAEMKVPGRAWLQFEVAPTATGSTITQTAIFDPSGLFGLAYWYTLWPIHTLIFGGMLRAIARRATSVSSR